jgi:hypothetical protein
VTTQLFFPTALLLANGLLCMDLHALSVSCARQRRFQRGLKALR